MGSDDQARMMEDERMEVTPVEGLRRSTRLQNPQPTSTSGGANDRQLEEDNVKVNANSTAKVSEAGGSDDWVGEPGKMSLAGQDPIPLEIGKVGGTIGKLGEASSSVPSASSPVAGAACRPMDEDGSSGESQGDEGAHPCLFIQTVLDIVFRHIVNQPGPTTNVAKDVWSIRQVCKSWKESATRVYRRHRPATLSFENYDQSHCRRGGKSLAEFVELMRSSEMIPIQKFQFRGRPFKHDGSLQLFENFFGSCGPQVVLLDFHLTTGDAENLGRSLKNSPKLDMPSLKTLKIHTVFQYPNLVYVKVNSSEMDGIVKLIERLLSAATSLEEFDLTYSPHGPFTYSKKQAIVKQQLGQVIASRISTTVTQLKLFMEMNESTFNKLVETGLKLKRFEFGVPKKLESGTLSKFLQSQTATLKALEIWNTGENRKDIFAEFPPLDELVQLELHDVIVSTGTGSDFAGAFPKLHHLDITWMTAESAVLSCLSNVKESMPQVKVLHLPVWRRASLAHIIHNLAKSFPCIAELHIALHRETKETMEEVFSHFDNVESLHISFEERIRHFTWADSVFSGVSEDDCLRIRSEDIEAVHLNQFQRQPSILNLTRMRKLVVYVCSKSPWVTFDDFAAHFIFLEMDSLREIHLQNWEVEFSPRYLDLLRNKLFLQNWI